MTAPGTGTSTGGTAMLELLGYEFIQNALVAGLLASVVCGLVGALVVVNRIVFISGGIAHAAYGGIGLAFFFGFSELLGAAFFALVSATVMAWVTLKNKQRADTVIGVLWAVGMAVGIILIDLSEGYTADLMSFLFGSIIAVSRQDLLFMSILTVIVVASVSWFYRDLLAMSFDEEYAKLAGVAVKPLYFLLLLLIALSVVLLIRVVGLILVIALFTIPPFIAEGFSRSLKSMMVLSVLQCAGYVLAGLGLAYMFDLTSGAVIILVASVFFFLSAAWKKIRAR